MHSKQMTPQQLKAFQLLYYVPKPEPDNVVRLARYDAVGRWRSAAYDTDDYKPRKKLSPRVRAWLMHNKPVRF